MPEISEIRIMSEVINKGITFNRVINRRIGKNPAIEKDSDFKINSHSKGKVLYADIDGELYQFGMGMTGNWYWFTSNNPDEESLYENNSILKHSRLIFVGKDSRNLALIDTRYFSRWKKVDKVSKDRSPCPMQELDDYTQYYNESVTKFLKRSKKPIYENLMNQKYFNGIGNYLRAEILGFIGNEYNINPLIESNLWLKETEDKRVNVPEILNYFSRYFYTIQGGMDNELSIKQLRESIIELYGEFKSMKFYQNRECESLKDKGNRTFWFDKKWDS